MKNDSTFKIIGIAILAIIALWFLNVILFPTGYGMYMNYTMPTHMENSFNYSYGFNNFGGSLTLLLSFLLKVLLVILVISLLVGLAMIVKNHVFTQEDIATMKNTFTGKSAETYRACTECNKTLNEQWKVCPHCGKEIDKL